MNDSIEDFNSDTRKGNGFSFRNKNAWSMYGAIIEALTVYHQRALWQRLVENALACDFSWDHAAEEYDDWYERVLHGRKSPLKKNDLLSLLKKAL